MNDERFFIYDFIFSDRGIELYIGEHPKVCVNLQTDVR